MSNRRVSAALVLVVLAAAGARAGTVDDLLAATAANARFTSPARATLELTRPDGDTVRAVLVGLGTTVRVDVADGARALVRPGRAVVRANGHVRRATPGATLPGTDLLLEELGAFSASQLRVPQISDDGPEGVVVTSAPVPPSPWALLVHTIDPERHVVTRTQWYLGAINNMVRIRRDGGFVEIDGHWRPGEATIDDITANRTSTLRLAWQPAPGLAPALLTPAGLAIPLP